MIMISKQPVLNCDYAVPVGGCTQTAQLTASLIMTTVQTLLHNFPPPLHYMFILTQLSIYLNNYHNYYTNKLPCSTIYNCCRDDFLKGVSNDFEANS